MKEIPIYNITDFPYKMVSSTVELVHKKKCSYVNNVASFDIETTSIKKEQINGLERDLGFMYVWQFAFEEYVCMGRTWSEFTYFIHKLADMCHGTLIVYVHNLGFEFQFMRNFFDWNEIFATEKRRPIYANTGNIQFRCSWRLSNMGLAKFTQNTRGVIHKKQSGEDFDYSIIRYPDTELTDEEYYYCVCDVLGLNEAIRGLMQDNNIHNVCDLPMTNTGFVRRDYMAACLEYPNYKKSIRQKRLYEDTYILCKEASRGAISGSTHLYTDEILEDIDSEDIKSSYPFQMCTKYFPASKFRRINPKNDTLFAKSLEQSCCLIVWRCKNLRLKKWRGIPYISKAKCRAIVGEKCGNGKVYSADEIGMCCTEIDFKIISDEYYYTDLEIYEIWIAERDMLSYPFRKHLLDMFQRKCDLEDGDPYIYMKYKNKINSSFGMMLTDIIRNEVVYKGGKEPWAIQQDGNIAESLNKHYKEYSTFLNYQDGIWVLAHGRDDLHEGMVECDRDLVQVDTDSCKHFNDHSKGFNEINKKIIEKAESYDIKPYVYNKDGDKVYLGIWEHEGKKGEYTYEKYKTLGAKKYAYIQDGKLHITIAGCNKKTGAKWLEQHGGINAFRNGMVIPANEKGVNYSGRTSSNYYDSDRIYDITVDGHRIVHGSYIAVSNVDYTLGMTSEWFNLVLDGTIEDSVNLAANGAFETWLK